MGEAGAGALSHHCRHLLASLPLRLVPGARRRRQFMLAPRSCLTSGPTLLRLALRPAQRVRTEALPRRCCRDAAVQADG